MDNVVSNINFVGILKFLSDKSISSDFLVEGSDVSLEFISNPKERVSWDCFNFIINKLVERVTDEDLNVIATYGVVSREYKVLADIVTGFLSPRFLYWAQSKFFGTYLFRNIKYSFKTIDKMNIEMIMDIGGKAPHPYFLETYRRVYEFFPIMIGAKESKVDLLILNPNRVKYSIRLMEKPSFKERFAPLLSIFKGARTSLNLLSELQEKQIELDKVNFELKQRNSEKDLLLKVVAHDISNPLALIHQTSVAISRKEQNNASVLKQISRIQRSTSKLVDSVEMVKSILNSKNVFFNNNQIFVKDVIYNSIELVSELARERKVSIINKVDESVRILGDANRLSMSVFSNLLTNCIRFSKKGGEVEISTVVGELEVAILIRDFGVGMNQLKIDQILGHSKVQSEYDSDGKIGQGYGMMIATSYLNTFNGKLRIESVTKEPGIKGHGTLFAIYFPIYDNIAREQSSLSPLQ